MSNSDLLDYIIATLDCLPNPELDLTGVESILTSEEVGD
ncbi:hypothetical protein LCGC14_2629060 [marine sediment metagenome]|uniref:Uncharacterized protein n=1 Tax=marine sediment metagenome TaxID=412755 RepID=A0A0F9ANE7_9ZZZZ